MTYDRKGLVRKKGGTLVIAEIGISHGGSAAKALEYVTEAAAMGCDGVKLQYQIPEKDLYVGHPWYRTLMESQLSHLEHKLLRLHAMDLGLFYGCTPFSVDAVEMVNDLEPDYIKVGGAGWTNLDMVDEVLKTDLPVVVSMACGLEYCSWADIRLRCISRYPTPLKHAVWEAQRCGPGWGLSDHSGTAIPAIIAIQMGAPMVEVHFPKEGPDKESSLHPFELEQICRTRDAVEEACSGSHDPEVVKLAKHDREKGWRRG